MRFFQVILLRDASNFCNRFSALAQIFIGIHVHFKAFWSIGTGDSANDGNVLRVTDLRAC